MKASVENKASKNIQEVLSDNLLITLRKREGKMGGVLGVKI